MEDQHNDSPQEENVPKFRGLYRYVKIPVKVLDAIIVVCIVVILIVFALEMRNPGFNVKFDSNGGSDVPAQSHMHGQLLDEPEVPSRQGYTFIGWFKDPNCDIPWDMETDVVESDMELYAGWQKNE